VSDETVTIEAEALAAANRGLAKRVLELLGSEEQFDLYGLNDAGNGTLRSRFSALANVPGSSNTRIRRPERPPSAIPQLTTTPHESGASHDRTSDHHHDLRRVRRPLP
jgi:hypothetical protein